MTRTFWHDFHPPHLNPLHGWDVELTVQEIEDAGLREILQTPGAALGSWGMLEPLLQPTGDGTPFVFREPLGDAREVKVALSGLFGRFVARAYPRAILPSFHFRSSRTFDHRARRSAPNPSRTA